MTAGRPVPIHPLLLAAYAVLFLYASNLGEADVGQVVPVLLVVVAVVGVLLVGGGLVLRDAGRAAVLLSASVALFFGYRHVQILTADLPVAGRPIQLVWVALGLGALVLAWKGGRALRTATRALNAVGLGLVAVALMTIVPHELGQLGRAEPSQVPVAPAPPPAAGGMRDIWFLVFDRYGSAESLRLNYGIEERLSPWLAEQGFHVTSDAYANYSRTRLSLASVLNLDYLDALPRGTSVAELLRNHAAGRFLVGLGYRYIHIGSRYGPTQTSVLATVNRTLNDTSEFASALFHSTLGPVIVRLTGGLDTRRQLQLDWARFELDALTRTLAEPGPKFVFAHLLLPHPPYVFDEHGQVVPDEADARRSTAQAYEAQMRYLDTRIQALLDPLLALPEGERPIVVVTADEGPYPARYEGNPLIQGPDPDFDWTSVTDDELRIKFGIIHAMLLPGVDASDVPRTMTAVNTFRFLFQRYYGADLPLLPDRILVPTADGGNRDVAGRLGVVP